MSDITDLTISDSIYDSTSSDYSVSVEGTKYLSLTVYNITSSPRFNFKKTDAFDSSLFSQFTVKLSDTDYIVLRLDGNDFKIVSKDNFSGELSESNQIELRNIDESTLIYPLTIIFIDSEGNVITKYTISRGEVNSSTVITFGAIDDIFVWKSELEELQTTIEELTARIAALEG